MILELIAKAVAGKLAGEFVKKLGKKLKTPPIEKAFHEAVCAFAQGYSLEKTENEGILRSFFEKDNVRGQLMNFTGFFGEKPNVDALRTQFEEAGFIQDQMPRFNFDQGVLRFVQTFKEISSQSIELQPFLQTKVQEQLLAEVRKLTKKKPPVISDLEAETNYLKQIRSQNRYMDSRGIAQMRNIVELGLDEIYVPLKAKKEVPLADTRRREEDERRKEEPRTEPDERELLKEQIAKREEPPLRIDEILKTQPNFVMLGDPGSGKTTVLKHLAFRAAQGNLDEEVTDDKTLLPLLLPIRQYSAAVSKGTCRGIRNYLPMFALRNELVLPDELLDKKLEAGECLLLFDGLDEVFDTHKRHEVVDDIANFLNRYSNNRFILTSRIAGYSAAPMVGSFPHYTLEDFGSDDIEQFVHKWCWAMENMDKKQGASKKRAEENAQELFDAMKMNDRVLKLASNPLMCTIIGLIHHQGQKLPNRRIELYDICVDTFIFSWELLKKEKSETYYDFDDRDVKTVLEHVGLWMHANREDNLIRRNTLEEKVVECLMSTLGKTRAEAEKQAQAFLELVRLRTGILLEKGEKLFGFMHLTFQEYFAACALTKKRRKFITEIGSYVRKPRWKEVILLSAARLGDQNPEDSTELVKAILSVEDEYEPHLHRNLLLAGRCLADDVMLDLSLRKDVFEQLSNLFTSTGVQALRGRIASVLGSMGKTRGQQDSLEILLSGLSHEDRYVRASAVRALGSLGVKDKEAVDKIIGKLGDKDSYVRDSAVRALGSLGVKDKEVVDKIIGKLGDKGGDVRGSAVRALGSLGVKDKEVVDKIIGKLGDEDGDVRASALGALGSLGVKDKEVVDKIIGKLGDEDVSVRASAVRALGSLGFKDKVVVDKIIGELGDEDWSVRFQAVDSLGSLRVKNKEVVDKIIGKLGDEDGGVRASAVSALGSLGVKDKEVVDKIIGKLGDEDEYVRAYVVRALGSLGVRDKEVVDKIIGKLGDEYWYLRVCAVRALNSLGVKDKEVVEKVIGKLGDEDRFVRISAVDALGSLGVRDKEVVDKIIAKLGDEDASMRASAVSALGNLGVKDRKVVDKIIGKLGDEYGSVRDFAYEALEKLTAE